MGHSKILPMQLKRILVAAFIFNFVFCGLCFAGFYRHNVDEIARKARNRIREIEKKVAEEKRIKDMDEVLVELQDIFERAEELYSQKRYEEAAKLYKEIERIKRDSKTKDLLEKKR